MDSDLPLTHSLSHPLSGECNFGDKSVIDFAEEYLKAGQENPHNFNTPSFVFVFFDGITESIAGKGLLKPNKTKYILWLQLNYRKCLLK